MPHDFLLEIGTEELPARVLQPLSKALSNNLEQGLKQAALDFASVQYFATPRRLAVLIKQLEEHQPDRTTVRRGPARQGAYDAQGNATPAALGFARSCGVEITQLETEATPQGEWLIYRQSEKGKAIDVLMPQLVQEAVAKLPIPKPMRWGDRDIAFVRPVQWLVMLYGNKIIEAEILGQAANYISYGHRFHHPEPLIISQANQYEQLLEQQGHIIADFAKRREKIQQQIIELAHSVEGEAIIDVDLLDEVTGIVEWPVAVLAHFDKDFLEVPQEALISAMQHHQKSFAVLDKAQRLMPLFITISNIASLNPVEVIRGNERVMRARLADAKFFFAKDQEVRLDARLDALKTVVFQKELGSVYEKSLRISQLAKFIATQINTNAEAAARAGLLCKADLISDMVNEFPELQGIMGNYYARHDGELVEVATAIREHYLPQFSGDKLPDSPAGLALALADRLDTVIGIFAINRAPSGDKDPFALRRAAVGILRILIEKELNLSLPELLSQALKNYKADLFNAETITQAANFIYERLRALLSEQSISADVFAAVYSLRPAAPFDFVLRIKAVNEFCRLPEATALIAANKRVSNLLLKENQQHLSGEPDLALLQESAEQQLMQSLQEKQQQIAPLYAKADYTGALSALAELQGVIDTFFDQVMVMVDDVALRNNRLLLLKQLHTLFAQIADIALLR